MKFKKISDRLVDESSLKLVTSSYDDRKILIDRADLNSAAQFVNCSIDWDASTISSTSKLNLKSRVGFIVSYALYKLSKIPDNQPKKAIGA